jgi:Domain of unknown function (DUF1841)
MLQQPSQHDVRRFFCDTHARQQAGLPMDAMQLTAAPWVQAHPEYNADLADADAAVAAQYSVEDGRTNPFLHLSMHLSISEQHSIDQPRGVRQVLDLLAARMGTMHEAHHVAMEALGQMIWTSQRNGLPPDGDAYVEDLRRRATR